MGFNIKIIQTVQIVMLRFRLILECGRKCAPCSHCSQPESAAPAPFETEQAGTGRGRDEPLAVAVTVIRRREGKPVIASISVL